MIIQETEGNIIHTYSDSGVMIHGGNPEGDYAEAYDPIDSGRTYTETDIPVPSEELTDTQALDIIMGREGHEPNDG